MYCVTTGVQSMRRLYVANRNKRHVLVDVHTVPVVDASGTTYGATMLLHDASPEATLEEKCQSLQERATKDPLTQTANRAEFDRAHQLFIEAHLDLCLPCSLIICDIDHFKSVNDTYGHQAGDEVLVSFGHLLKSECRPGDLVARYGGEEFVMLCADCNNASAARRADQLRQAIAELPQASLNGASVTVSFGVTEIQPGDTCESMLRRADRALLEAKRIGRNAVIQLGDGLGESYDVYAGRPSQASAAAGEALLHSVLVTDVPLKIAVAKLRGFVLDHNAEVVSVCGDRIELEVETWTAEPSRRRSDRRVPLVVEMALSEQRVEVKTTDGRSSGYRARTRAVVSVRLKRNRDRRLQALGQHAEALMAGIRAYLMACDESLSAESNGQWRAARILMPPTRRD
jgi:diguanylate cyclase (GGDEF)-like protein